MSEKTRQATQTDARGSGIIGKLPESSGSVTDQWSEGATEEVLAVTKGEEDSTEYTDLSHDVRQER